MEGGSCCFALGNSHKLHSCSPCLCCRFGPTDCSTVQVAPPMTSPIEPPQGRNAPAHRKVPQSLTTSFFSKSSRRPSELRSPAPESPSINTRSSASPLLETLPVQHGFGNSEHLGPHSEPISIPEDQYGSYKQKKLAPNTFNTHYRSISRSMNDLGNIFTRGRSPPNRDGSPRRVAEHSAALSETKRRRQTEEIQPEKQYDAAAVPSISVNQHGDQAAKGQIIKEGWVNVIDSGSVKKGPLRDAWRLQHAVLSDTFLVLYKPPSSLQIRAFEIGVGSPTTQRPQSAPATASPAFNVSSLRHKTGARHPELKINADGRVQGGTVEALCHELIFTKDNEYVDWAVRSLSGWTGPETALSVLVELSAVNNLSVRNAEIVNILATTTPGLLLEAGTYNCARLLVEKGISPHNHDLAQECRTILEDTRASLQAALDSSIYPHGRFGQWGADQSAGPWLIAFGRSQTTNPSCIFTNFPQFNGRRIFTYKSGDFCHSNSSVPSEILPCLEPSQRCFSSASLAASSPADPPQSPGFQ